MYGMPVQLRELLRRFTYRAHTRRVNTQPVQHTRIQLRTVCRTAVRRMQQRALPSAICHDVLARAFKHERDAALFCNSAAAACCHSAVAIQQLRAVQHGLRHAARLHPDRDNLIALSELLCQRRCTRHTLSGSAAVHNMDNLHSISSYQ